MSNQFLKLRRSGVPGKIPSTSSIDFGEIALNTYDGIAYMKRSGSNGEEVIPIGLSGSLINTGSFLITASAVNNVITFTKGDNSSFNVTVSGSGGPNFEIISGSVFTRVNIDPNQIFLIGSGSTTYHQIASNGDTNIYSDLFIIKNNTTQQPVLTVSQSVVQFATQSLSPLGIAPNGGFWFTSTDLYVGLD